MNNTESELNDKLDKLCDKLDSLECYINKDEKKTEEYFHTLRECQSVRAKIDKLTAARAMAKQENHQKPDNHVFINAFGEATKRYITNTTYEIARKRECKRIMDFLS